MTPKNPWAAATPQAANLWCDCEKEINWNIIRSAASGFLIGVSLSCPAPAAIFFCALIGARISPDRGRAAFMDYAATASGLCLGAAETAHVLNPSHPGLATLFGLASAVCVSVVAYSYRKTRYNLSNLPAPQNIPG